MFAFHPKFPYIAYMSGFLQVRSGFAS